MSRQAAPGGTFGRDEIPLSPPHPEPGRIGRCRDAAASTGIRAGNKYRLN